jgi:acyl-CoA reductase-like NAD-dependent aldehyde dehydrogenase
MRHALSRYKTFIDDAPPSPGATTTPKDLNMAYVSVNPFDGKTLKTFAEMTDAALETALATATEASMSNSRLRCDAGARGAPIKTG